MDDIKFLTVEEQKIFLETAKRSHNYRQYVLLLETGLRTSEMIGLTWEFHRLKKADIDRQQDTGISTQYKNMAFRSSKVEKQLPHYSADKPGIRYTQIVLRRTFTRKESELLSQILEYVDRRTGETKYLCMRDLVFINSRTGKPAKTVPMILICTSCSMKVILSVFVCTL